MLNNKMQLSVRYRTPYANCMSGGMFAHSPFTPWNSVAKTPVWRVLKPLTMQLVLVCMARRG